MTTSSSPAIQRGDVIYVPVVFTDRRGLKRRPAVVVSSNQYNQQTPDLVIATITSNLNTGPHPGDHVIADWRRAGLPKPSLVQAKLTTIAQALVRRKIGSFSPRDLAAFGAGLQLALAL
jgi:mRNA interferase MazF